MVSSQWNATNSFNERALRTNDKYEYDAYESDHLSLEVLMI